MEGLWQVDNGPLSVVTTATSLFGLLHSLVRVREARRPWQDQRDDVSIDLELSKKEGPMKMKYET